jgi:hypothetical protein
MIAVPLIPGRLYRVRAQGFTMAVLAPNGGAAIAAATPLYAALRKIKQ